VRDQHLLLNPEREMEDTGESTSQKNVYRKMQVLVDGFLPGKMVGSRGGFQENDASISSWKAIKPCTFKMR
jgi:hypothetical protein